MSDVKIIPISPEYRQNWDKIFSRGSLVKAIDSTMKTQARTLPPTPVSTQMEKE
jgi:hypothetical protein